MSKKKLYQKLNTIQVLRENRDLSIHLRLVQLTWANGEVDSVMVPESRSGPTAQAMKDTGKITEPKAKASSFILMVMFMKETGSMIKQMDMESMSTSMALSMKVIGRMIYSMDRVRSLGLMDLFILVVTKQARKTAMVYICGTMAANTKETGLKTRSKVTVHTLG